MELEFITHLNTIGSKISKELRSGRYSEFKIITAYVKNSGVSRIYNDLLAFKNNKGKVMAIVGIDQKQTSYQALINLKTFTQNDLFIHHDKNIDITFHPKIYIFSNKYIEKIFLGSSNLTAGGFYLNFEANVGILLDKTQRANKFRDQINNYWDSLVNDNNTKKGEKDFIDNLFKRGILSDDNKRKRFKEIIEKISDLPFESRKIKGFPKTGVKHSFVIKPPRVSNTFAMTLAGFDVSSRSQDPVILIPIKALKQNPEFWNWPRSYEPSLKGYPQHYVTATIKINGNRYREQHIRLYYYDLKSEFRLQCEPIKRNGGQGDIVLISKDYNNPLEFNIELIRSNAANYSNLRGLLTNKASSQKFCAYL